MLRRYSFSGTEAVEGAARALERVDDLAYTTSARRTKPGTRRRTYIEGSDCLALGVLSVGDAVAHNVLEELLEDAAGLLHTIVSMNSNGDDQTPTS